MTGSYSIVIPVYNGERYLREAIDSALRQTWQAARIVLVDDGSTDSSGTVCDEYATKHPDIVKAVHRPNGGLSAARNTGMEHVSSEWILFLDADDILYKDATAALACAARHNDDTDLIIGACDLKDSTPDRHIDFSRTRQQTPEQAIEESLYQNGVLHAAWGKLYRTALARETGFTEGILYEDLDFFYRYCLRCRRVAVTDSAVLYYRQHAASIVHVWNPRRADVLDITDRIEAFMADSYPNLLGGARDRKFSANFNIFLLATANGDSDIADRCWDVIRGYRHGALTDPKVRIKNKAGALLSYIGRPLMKIIATWAGK